ncbi:MAG: TIGR04283 family arsenosugar biosynthesis glycosyltransferase [Deltaproteobacteria bacterium]|nr:TIGR04283 family arsenosugar biosynthesis glycosyltransferase [Deltaproteobacteria bacterium]
MGADYRIVVFTRYPVPGRSKTRLIPALGPAGAAEVQRRLTEETLAKARRFASDSGTETEVCFDGGTSRQMRRWLGPGLIMRPQNGADLGSRMESAFDDAFREGCRRVVLHGTDIPGLSVSHLREAFSALDRHDLVLGPSTDGGYWLMGLRRPVRLFEGIEWGEASVLEATLARAAAQGLTTHLLKPLTDIDTAGDLNAVLPVLEISRPYVSVIIPALNEEENVQRCIQSAADPDSEIIVVDGGSGDHTVPTALRAGGHVLHSRPGRGLQQNLGADEARGVVILFLHADTILPARYVGHVFECLMDPRLSAGAFRFKTDFGHPLMRMIECLVNFRSRYLGLPYGDQGLFMRRNTFRSAGGFPSVPIAEDLLLVRRLASLGRVEMAKAAVITSGRKWQQRGIARTTVMHQMVVIGLLLGISPKTLERINRGV